MYALLILQIILMKNKVDHSIILAYEVMEKELNKASTDICYDER